MTVINKKEIINLNKLRHQLNRLNNHRDTSYINDEKDISIEDLYYILKFYGMDVKDLTLVDKLFLGHYIDYKSLTKFEKLALEDDDRIFIIPPQIEFNALITYMYNQVLYSLEELNLKPETSAVYLSNWGQINTLHRALEDQDTNIEKLLIKKSLIDSYKSVYGFDLKQTIIEVPDNIEYKILSNYLDKNINSSKKLIKK